MFKNKKPIKIISFIVFLSLNAAVTACGGGGLTIKDDEDYSLPPSESESDTETESLGTTVSFDETTETEAQPSSSVEETEPPESETRTEEPILSATEENKLTMTAETLIGIPFADGGSSPDFGFDNSGFIYYVLKQNGYVNCPRGLSDQAAMGVKISQMNELKSGDLVFFSENGENAQFGGIYKGDGIMISCQSPGQTVKETDISTKYYVNNFFTGVRVL